jgi:hypothetical protein
VRRLAILLIASWAISAQAQDDPGELFSRAGSSYDHGEFGLAAAQYDSLLNAGFTTPEVYFNLGNSFFRAGYLGHAIWAYRSAARLAPRDPDIKSNLTVARLSARDRIEARTPSLLQQVWRTTSQLLSFSEGARLVTALWLLVWIAVALASMWPASRRVVVPAIKVTGLLWALAFAVLAARYMGVHSTTAAVVIAVETHARSAPGEDEDVIFSGHPGLECVVRGRRDEYLLVELANGRVGWLPAVDLKQVES